MVTVGKIVSMPGPKYLVSLVAFIIAPTLTAQRPAPQVRTPSVLPINAITITGNKTLPTDAILAASGLKINAAGSTEIFDAARDRLVDTGYFETVSYTFHQQDLGFAVAFTVAEHGQIYPVRLEGLPIAQSQFTQLLKSTNPLFNGSLPAAKQAIEGVISTVEQYLAPTNPDLHVHAKVAFMGPDRYEIQLLPAEGLPIIANVTFEGSAVVKEADLQTEIVENCIGQPFSDSSMRDLLDRFIRPFFEKLGYMRVSFPQITAKPAAGVKGVEVHVAIADGPRFKLGEVSVRGDLEDSRRILRMANLPRADFVNGDDIAQSVTRIHDTLRGEGYLDAAVSADHAINDSANTMDLWFQVNPGVLYKFGHLEVLGLGLDGEAAIRKLWSVKPGDPFPGAYPDYFISALRQEDLFDNLGDIKAVPAINHQTHVVDVTLNFTGAAPSAKKRAAQY